MIPQGYREERYDGFLIAPPASGSWSLEFGEGLTGNGQWSADNIQSLLICQENMSNYIFLFIFN
jgi:hypothetical protein